MIDWNTQALRQYEREQDKEARILKRQAELMLWECNPTHVENIEEAWPNLDLAGIAELLEKGETDFAGRKIAEAIRTYWEQRAWTQAKQELT